MGIITISVAITGTVFVALALLSILGISIGSALNEIVSGLGNLSIGVGVVALAVLIIFGVLYLYNQ